jgi:hypothetical protein
VNELFDRLRLIEEKLNELLSLQGESSVDATAWIDSKAFCAATGIRDKASLHYYMSKGIIRDDALRNIGTTQRPRYRFHRTKAVDQFLNRTNKP